MRKIIGKLSSAVTDSVAKLSLRSVVLALAILILFLPWQPKPLQALDEILLKASTFLIESPKGVSSVAIVEVPSADMYAWERDINASGKLGNLLSNILLSSNAVIGLILDQPLDTRTGVADRVMEAVAKSAGSKLKKSAVKDAKELVRRKAFLLEFLTSDRVILGVSETSFEGQPAIETHAGIIGNIPPPIPDWLWPLGSQPSLSLRSKPSIAHYPIFVNRSYERFLVQRDRASKQSYGAFLLYFFRTALLQSQGELIKSKLKTPFVWQKDQGIKFDDTLIHLSPSGKYIPVHSATERMQPLINTMSLEEALARNAFPDYVFIAKQDSRNASDLAMAAFSLANKQIYHSPWWVAPLGKSLIVLISVFALLAVPRLQTKSVLLITFFAIFFAVLGQIILSATRGLWLPLASQAVWFGVAVMMMLIWRRRQREWSDLRQHHEEACTQQAQYFADKGDLNSAMEVLKPCTSSDRVLQKMYEIAGLHANKKQYKQAINILKHLHSRRRKYKDTEQKIQTLMSMASSTDHALEKTAVIDSNGLAKTKVIENRVLGRYELKEELGRGAMGTVYLGFDPKIARYVAIKTLNYQQFQSKEREDLKARFYREAEAAGRLSHPNIVSVYDVGEEDDLAFIAMDFVEGKALNAFVAKETLLPVFEVYRLIGDVAVALEYAHNNNIVHRDIKPGNIMYNASPYLVKVTDFGIARLVDDSKTSTGEILGSPLYMAPEQLKGKKVNHSADVFSLGVTFYQLLTGSLPFQGNNLASLTYEIIHGRHKSIRRVRKDLPASAGRIINQALQKDPADRYESSAEMALVIKRAIKRDFAQEARQANYI